MFKFRVLSSESLQFIEKFLLYLKYTISSSNYPEFLNDLLFFVLDLIGMFLNTRFKID